MSLGIRTSVGPFVVHQSLRPGRSTAAATRNTVSVLVESVKLAVYLLAFTVMAAWWMLKWTAVATYLSARWAVTTATPAVRRQWEARREQRSTSPA